MPSIPVRRSKANPDGRMAVLDHLRELRRRLIIVLIIIAAGAIIGWFIYNPVLNILKEPYCRVPASHRLGGGTGKNCRLIFTAPLDGFTIRLKISVILGAIFTAPFWLYQLWAFVTPGLRKHERKWTITFVMLSTILFIAGMTLAFLVLRAGILIVILAGGSSTQAALTITSYISFVTLMLTIFGAAFELPLLIVLLNLAHVLPYRLLKKWQRLGIFLIFLFAGVATPTADPFTMCAMAVPMVILFEAAVLFTYFHDKRRAKQKAVETDTSLDDHEASQINPIPESLSDSTDHSAIP
ncbi:MAG: twin-arginine translocase subunit TatC [Jatrophihabitans sp.]